jgi:hypothetical protein
MNVHAIVTTYALAMTYVTDRLLTSIKDVIRLSGLNPAKIAADWAVLERGIKTWLQSQDLQELHLEVYDPKTASLIGRWDFDIRYEFSGDGSFWVDPEAIRYHILKQGHWPACCQYLIVATTNPRRPDVEGWSRTTLRSTVGFVRQCIGTTIDASGLAAGASYWRRIL